MIAKIHTTWALLLPLSAVALAQDRYMPGRGSSELQEALNANPDVLGEAILAGGEPSFERVASIFPPLGRPRSNVGVAEHPEEIGVGWDGTIELAQNRKISFRLGDPPSPYGFDGPIEQSLLEGYLPVVITRWRYDSLEYGLSVFGHSPGMSPDAEVTAYAALAVHNPSAADRTAHVTVYSFPALGGAVPKLQAQVSPGRRRELCFRIPWLVSPERLVEAITPRQYADKLREVRSCWEALLAPGMLFRTPETRVNDGQLAWLMYNFLNVDKIGGWCQIHDGGRFYEDVYGYSAALYCHALSLYGYWERADRYLRDMLHYQQPEGQFRTSYGTPDNGAVLYAIGQHYRLSRNDKWFAGMVPAIERCCRWIAGARAKTRTLNGDKHPLTYGLLASGDKPYADYPGEVFSYYVDCYCWLGLREAGLALVDAGMESQGKHWLAEAETYREDILRSMESSLIDLGDNFKALPIEPMTQRLIKQGGGDYYGLIAPMLLETNFFAPDDPRAEWITSPMEKLGGLMLGLSRFADGIDHAYTYGYAMSKLRRGDVERFLLTFYGSLAHGMDRGTYSSVEVNHAPAGINDPTLPHTYSHTQQLRWVRMMLVREEGDELWLASGTPRAWLARGNGIRVDRAPTLFGRISYTIRADEPERSVTARIGPIEQDRHTLPRRAVLALRPPEKLGVLQSVTVNGKEWPLPEDGCLSLDGRMLAERIDVVARYR